MDILLREARAVTLPSGARQTYPAGWTGDAPEAAARAWIDEGVAVRLGPSPVAAAALTPKQTAILAAAANEIEKAQIAATAAATAPVSDGTGEGATDEVDLEAMSDDQLAAVAADLGITPGRRSRARLIDAIAKKAAQLDAAEAAAAAAANTGNDA
jgi:hypothetical protein